MEIPKEITRLSAELTRQREYLATLKEVYESVPKSTRDALKAKWVMAAEKFVGDKVKGYSLSAQEVDHRRVIPLDVALQILEDLEEKLVDTQVLDVVDLIWKRLGVLRVAGREVIDHGKLAWAVLVEVFGNVLDDGVDVSTVHKFTDHIGAMLSAIFTLITVTFTAKAFAAVAISVVGVRNSSVDRMRKRALPQPPAKRYRRRKRAR